MRSISRASWAMRSRIAEGYAERPRTKLPQGRHYLKAARWGFEEMVKHRHLGPAFVFHIVGILTMLRAVPFALYGKDRTLSVAHTASVYALIASQGIEVRP